MKFDENLASVHAYLCADGYVVKNPPSQIHKYYRAGFRNTNLVLLRDFQDKFEKVFGIKPRLVEGQRCEKGSKEIYELLTKEFGSFYSWHWKMPELPLELSKIWLRAYFDCEGWVTCKSHQNRHIGLDCVNEKGINQIKVALDKLRIPCKLKFREKQKIYRMHIFGRDNLIRFDKEIGFLHPLKKEKLKKALADFVDYDWKFPTKEGELIEFIKNILILRGKIRKDNGILRLISKEEFNLIRVQKELNRLFNIESKVNKRTNGIGTVYFELNVNKKDNIQKLIKNNLINNEEKEKWLKLKK